MKLLFFILCFLPVMVNASVIAKQMEFLVIILIGVRLFRANWSDRFSK